MKEWRFEISSRSGFADVVGQGVLEDIRELGIRSVESVHSARVYLIEADFDAAFAKRVVEELLTDTVCQDYYIGRSSAPAGPMEATIIEVHLKSGVTDPVAQSVAMAIADMGGRVQSVRTAQVYPAGACNGCSEICRGGVGQRLYRGGVYGTDAEPPSPHTRPYELQIVEIPITGLDSDGLME